MAGEIQISIYIYLNNNILRICEQKQKTLLILIYIRKYIIKIK